MIREEPSLIFHDIFWASPKILLLDWLGAVTLIVRNDVIYLTMCLRVALF